MTKQHKVKQGECMASIADRYGFFWHSLWDLPENAELKEKRKGPNILFPGDQVFIPDKREKTESVATEQLHRFRRKGVPEKLRLALKNMDKPRANEPFILDVDGTVFSGDTDAEGILEVSIPPDAKQGKLSVGRGDNIQEFDLQLGHLDPITEVSGIQSRLNNLGIDCGEVDGVLGPKTREAIRVFQKKQGLDVTGKPDGRTRKKLIKEYGT